jgi:hypothetical protein
VTLAGLCGGVPAGGCHLTDVCRQPAGFHDPGMSLAELASSDALGTQGVEMSKSGQQATKADRGGQRADEGKNSAKGSSSSSGSGSGSGSASAKDSGKQSSSSSGASSSNTSGGKKK